MKKDLKISDSDLFALDFALRLEMLGAAYSQLWLSLMKLEKQLKERKK